MKLNLDHPAAPWALVLKNNELVGMVQEVDTETKIGIKEYEGQKAVLVIDKVCFSKNMPTEIKETLPSDTEYL